MALAPFAVARADDGREPLAGIVTLAGTGLPASAVEVRLLFGLASETRRTDAEGRYAFERAAPGKYTVRVLPPEGLHVVGDASVGIAIEDGTPASPRPDMRVNFTLAPARISVAAVASAPATAPSPVPISPTNVVPASAATDGTAGVAATDGASNLATKPVVAPASIPATAPTTPVVVHSPVASATSARPAATPAPAMMLPAQPAGLGAATTSAPTVMPAPAASPSSTPAPSAVILPSSASRVQPPSAQPGAEAPPTAEAASSPSAAGSIQPSPAPAPEAEPSQSGPTAPEAATSGAATSAEVAALPPALRPPPSAGSPSPSPSPMVADVPPAEASPEVAVADEHATVNSTATIAASEVVLAPRRVVSSFAEMRTDGVRSEAMDLRATATDALLLLGVPFRTQIDGSPFSLVNCGPASLAMVLTAFGLDVDPPSVRDYLNYLIGSYDTDAGTSLYVLSGIAREAGLSIFGAAGGGSLHGWTVDAVRQQVAAGRPVITLTKYRKLPGHLGSQTDFDHYIVITGLSGGDFIYNDAAYATQYGQNLVITPSELEQAWASSSNPRHAVAIGLGDAIRALPVPPSRPVPPARLVVTVAQSSGQVQAQAEAQALDVSEHPTAFPTPTRAPIRPPALERLRERLLEDLGARSTVVDETMPSGI